MSKYTIQHRSNCRLCSSSQLKKIIHFDSVPFFDEVIRKENIGKEFLAPMDIFWCSDCKSVQSLHDVNVEDYYVDYQYVASDSPFIQNFMNAMANWVAKRFNFLPGFKVIDIGSANGYQLKCFQNLGANVLGFEPAANLCDLSREQGVPVVQSLFTGNTIQLLPEEFQKVHCITLLHTFDHLLDPAPFLEVVKKVLDPVNGVLILEVHDLSEIIYRKETSLFGHEHATFLQPLTMSRFLSKFGLKILDINFIDENQRRGNSMLLAIGNEQCLYPISTSVSFSRYEQFDEWQVYADFELNVKESFARLKSYITDRRSKGKKVVGYGAWGRGVTTLSMAEITSEIMPFVVDKNPSLHGCYTPGSRIPIESVNSIFTENVDEVVVFCYGYMEEIKRDLKQFLDAGGIIHSVIDLLR